MPCLTRHPLARGLWVAQALSLWTPDQVRGDGGGWGCLGGDALGGLIVGGDVYARTVARRVARDGSPPAQGRRGLGDLAGIFFPAHMGRVPHLCRNSRCGCAGAGDRVRYFAFSPAGCFTG